MRFSLFRSAVDTIPTHADRPWTQIVGLLGDFDVIDCAPCPGSSCPSKLGAAWSPCAYKPNTTRGDANVEAITCAVFDCDHLTEEDANGFISRLEGISCCIHSTHSHQPDDQSYRVVIQLDREMSPAEWVEVHKTLAELFDLPIDPKCKSNPSRLFFMPTVRKGHISFFREITGSVLRVDQILGMRSRISALQAAPQLSPKVDDLGSRNSEIGKGDTLLDEPPRFDLDDLRGCLIKARRSLSRKSGAEEKHQAIANVLDGKPIATEGKRDDTINFTMSTLAFLLPLDTPWQAAIAIVRTSIFAMVCEPEGFDHWIKIAQSSFVRAQQRRRDIEAEKIALHQGIRDMLAGKPKPIESAIATVTQEDRPLSKLIMSNEGTIKNTGFNVALLLEHGDDLKGTIRFNEVTKNIDIVGGPFVGVNVQTLHVHVSNWLNAQIRINTTPNTVAEQLQYIARKQAYDPLHDYLKGLYDRDIWDRVPRGDNFLRVYLGALPRDGHGDNTESYLKLISKRWLISAVARGLNPGCKVDTVLITEAGQGKFKSSAWELLGGEFYTSSPIVFGSKDSMQLAARVWIAELAEVISLKKSEVETVKAFLTTRKDDFRPPYGKAVESFPRRCVFVGTTNEESYLTDHTGNRRYWPVKVGKADLEAIERDRDQLWAEAVYAYFEAPRVNGKIPRDSYLWWLNDEGALVAEDMTSKRAQYNPAVDTIQDWYLALKPPRSVTITIPDVATGALLVPPDMLTDQLANKIRRALEELGFIKCQRTVNNRRRWFFEAPQWMIDAPQGKNPGLARVAVTPISEAK